MAIKSQSKSKLLVIMFTDIAGYTEMMGSNSEVTIKNTNESFRIQKQVVEKFNGKWVKELGDGTISTFESAIDAVGAAIEIQSTDFHQNSISLKIGIHLGDIIEEDNDIHGDGVNITSRIQDICNPRGIFISDSVDKSIRGIPSIRTVFLGELEFKNVSFKVRTYAIKSPKLKSPDYRSLREKLSGTLIAETRRKGVFRVALVYILVSLILFQILNIFLDISGIYWLLIMLGFPLSIYLAWIYDRSPQGFVLTNSQDAWENPFNQEHRKPFTSKLSIGILLLIGLVSYIPPLINSDYNHNQKISIAVLPFESIGEDSSQYYFSKGIHEDIIYQISKIQNISVKSRTSTLQYETPSLASIGKIGKDLSVSHILEGSVQKDGTNVRITAQLIDVQNDEHIWSQNFDGELNDIFKIQDSISVSIAKSLKLEFSDSLFEDYVPDQFAYDYTLKAWDILFNYNSEEDIEKAMFLSNQAIKLDPGYYRSYYLKGLCQWWSSEYNTPTSFFIDSALWNISKSLSLRPDFIEGYIVRAEIYRHPLLNLDKKSEDDLERILEITPYSEPEKRIVGQMLLDLDEFTKGSKLMAESYKMKWSSDDAKFYMDLGATFHRFRMNEVAKKYLLKSMEINPNNAVVYNQLHFIYKEEEDWENVLFTAKKCKEINPNWWFNTSALSFSYLMNGDYENAEMEMLNLKEMEKDNGIKYDTIQYLPWRHRLAYLYRIAGEEQEAIRLAKEDLEIINHIISLYPTDRTFMEYYGVATIQAFLGNIDEAVEALKVYYKYGHNTVTYLLLKNDKHFEPYKNDPVFTHFYDSLQFSVDSIDMVFRRRGEALLLALRETDPMGVIYEPDEKIDYTKL